MQAHALGGEQAVAVQEGSGGLQGRVFATAQDVLEDEAEQALVGPFAAFQKEDLAGREKQHPAWGMVAAEDAAGDDVFPGLGQHGFGWRDLAVVLVGVGAEGERVFVFAFGVVGAKDE